MAIMIPNDIEQFNTDGEEAFYRFLISVAKPDELYIVWYTPEVNDSEPDFILFCHELGLVIFEVKDWRIEQIREVNPKKFLVAFGSKLESCTNPYEQAKGYSYKIIDCLTNDGRLACRDKLHYGKPKIPISCGVVFPNINSMEYRERFGNECIIPSDKIFFWDDLNTYSDLHEPTGKKFLEALKKRFEPIFPCQLSPKELICLREILYPCIRIPTVDRGPSLELNAHEEKVRLLDHHQEVIARKFDSGHRIITGPSGSGKTLVLIHQAVFLQKYNPAMRRILFVCFNLTLVNYIRRLLTMQGAHLGATGVEVLTFYELCERLTGEKVLHENQDKMYYELVTDEALANEVPPAMMYDAILVDEGQDFSDSMLQVVTRCLNKKTDVLTIALDEGQDVYHTKRSWNKVGIQAKGRSKHLNRVYRNTKEIAELAASFRGSINCRQDGSNKQISLFPDFQLSRGPCPIVRQFESLKKEIEFTVQEIRRLLDVGAFPMSEIAILYTMKKPNPRLLNSIPGMFASALDQAGIMNKWLSEDYRTKRSHDITTNSVTITTIHSVKGLDYACVFLVGLDELKPCDRWIEEQITSLAYVGITRARYQLYITYVEQTELIKEILHAYKECQFD
jgi:hypothetical protein